MTPQELREKHRPVFQSIGKAGDLNYCAGCKTPNNVLATKWPCDVILALEGLTPGVQ